MRGQQVVNFSVYVPVLRYSIIVSEGVHSFYQQVPDDPWPYLPLNIRQLTYSI